MTLAVWLPRTAVLLATVVLVGCSSSPAGRGDVVRTSSVDLPPSYVFQPAAIEVRAGSTVTWTNHDNFTHSVQVQGSGVDTSVHMLTPGQMAQITFTSPGTYNYVCTLHAQNMKGTVVVDQA